MFDTVRCEMLLPVDGLEGEDFQTKDTGCNLDTITIRADGTVWLAPFQDPDDDSPPPPSHPMDAYLGRIDFYTYTDDKRWLEFSVDVVYGRVTKGPILTRDIE